MKKIIVFCTLASVVSFTSCHKKDSNSSSVDLNKVALNNSSGPDECWDDQQKDCLTPALDCGPTVIIHGIARANLDLAISQGSIAIAQYFSNTQGSSGEFNPGLTSQNVIKLQSGTYGMLPIPSGSNPNVKYYICGNAATLSHTNYDFVLATKLASN